MLKVTMSRIKLLRGRREVQVRQLRRDVAQLLQLGQEENAESRLDRLWKEHSLLSAYVKIGEYCQLVKANLRNIAGQRECPMDLKESLASLCFAASCCADLPELQEIRDIMVIKYGKEFLTSAHELLPGEHVNKLFLEAFSTKQPLEVSKKALLKGIVAEYNVVQPRKPKVPCIGGGSQKTSSTDCNFPRKQQSRHECASNSESCRQYPNLSALEQEEKQKKSPKQIRHTASLPTHGAFNDEHASLPHVEGDSGREMVGQRKKEQKVSQFQVDTVWGGANETDLGSQDRLSRAFPHKHGKEKFRNRLKVSKKNARVNQAGQEDQHTSSNGLSMYEISGPDKAASEVTDGLHGYGNTTHEKSSLDKETKGFVSEQQRVQEHGKFYSNAKHREVAYGIDYRQSPHSNNRLVPEKRERPHADSKYTETKHKHHSRSNGKSRPERVSNDLGNNQQERSPCKRNYHVEGDTRFEITHPSDETSRPGKEAYEIENWPKGNGSLPDYVDGTHKVQREKRHSLKKNHENAGTKDFSGDHNNAHMLHKGKKQHVKKHHSEETQQEAWADYRELVIPERAMNQSPNSYTCADDNRYDSNYPARQRERNLHLTENNPTAAKTETCWDREEGRQIGSALEFCMDGEHFTGDCGHARQKHKRLARKHKSDHAKSTLKILDGDVEPKQERVAEGAVNGLTHWPHNTNGPFISEDHSNYVAQKERAHFPQWHHQFDPKPKSCESSTAVGIRSLPQVHNTHGLHQEQKHPESLDVHENFVAKPRGCEGVKDNCSPSRFSKPPQRPPPPVPPYRVSSLPNRKPVNSPPALPQRCATFETGHVRVNQEPHVHPKLPEYEDLIASFAALRNKPARPATE